MGVRKKKLRKCKLRRDNKATLNINYSMSVTSEFEFKINSTSMSFQCLMIDNGIFTYLFYLWNANVIRFPDQNTLSTGNKQIRNPQKEISGGFFLY